MKKFVAVLAIALLAGCSSMGNRQKDQPKVNADFMGGSIRMTYTMTGGIVS